VRELGSPRGLEVGQQVELAGVVGAVVHTAQRDAARSLATAAKRPGNQVGWVDAVSAPQTMHVVRRRGIRARSWARRRSGVRFIGCSFLLGSWWMQR
jgi:hypothetical protein